VPEIDKYAIAKECPPEAKRQIRTLIAIIKAEDRCKDWEWEYLNFKCSIKRNHSLALCGYVGVSKRNELFGKDGEKLWAHGGISFSHHMEDEEIWWFGFDCSHGGDLSPSFVMGEFAALTGAQFMDFNLKATYRDFEYVKEVVQDLAEQLIKYNA
jgi:hypothetical protein